MLGSFVRELKEQLPYLPSFMKEFMNMPSKIDEQILKNAEIVISPMKEIELETKTSIQSKELEKVKTQLKEIQELNKRMRKKYFDDINNYRGVEMRFEQQYDDPEEQRKMKEILLSIEHFNIIEGLDHDLMEIVNSKILKVKEQCQ